MKNSLGRTDMKGIMFKIWALLTMMVLSVVAGFRVLGVLADKVRASFMGESAGAIMGKERSLAGSVFGMVRSLVGMIRSSCRSLEWGAVVSDFFMRGRIVSIGICTFACLLIMQLCMYGQRSSIPDPPLAAPGMLIPSSPDYTFYGVDKYEVKEKVKGMFLASYLETTKEKVFDFKNPYDPNSGDIFVVCDVTKYYFGDEKVKKGMISFREHTTWTKDGEYMTSQNFTVVTPYPRIENVALAPIPAKYPVVPHPGSKVEYLGTDYIRQTEHLHYRETFNTFITYKGVHTDNNGDPGGLESFMLYVDVYDSTVENSETYWRDIPVRIAHGSHGSHKMSVNSRRDRRKVYAIEVLEIYHNGLPRE